MEWKKKKKFSTREIQICKKQTSEYPEVNLFDKIVKGWYPLMRHIQASKKFFFWALSSLDYNFK